LRIERERSTVRETVIQLDSRGIYPSKERVEALVRSGVLMQKAMHEEWRDTLKELGYNQ
jgi:hypothetical protein